MFRLPPHAVLRILRIIARGIPRLTLVRRRANVVRARLGAVDHRLLREIIMAAVLRHRTMIRTLGTEEADLEDDHDRDQDLDLGIGQLATRRTERTSRVSMKEVMSVQNQNPPHRPLQLLQSHVLFLFLFLSLLLQLLQLPV